MTKYAILWKDLINLVADSSKLLMPIDADSCYIIDMREGKLHTISGPLSKSSAIEKICSYNAVAYRNLINTIKVILPTFKINNIYKIKKLTRLYQYSMREEIGLNLFRSFPCAQIVIEVAEDDKNSYIFVIIDNKVGSWNIVSKEGYGFKEGQTIAKRINRICESNHPTWTRSIK